MFAHLLRAAAGRRRFFSSSSHSTSSSSKLLPGGYYKYQASPASIVDFGLDEAREVEAREIHDRLLIFDTIAEVSLYDGFVTNMRGPAGGRPAAGSLSVGNRGLQRNSGSCSPPAEAKHEWWSKETLLEDIAFVKRWIRESESGVALCLDADDIRRAHRDDKVGIMLDVQNAEFVHKDLDLLDVFYELGLRRVQLTYNFCNLAGTGCMESEEGLLSRHGRAIVRRMNDLGMVVDTGHCSSRTVLQAVEVSERPIACSHAGMRRRCPTNPRTQTDEAIFAVARAGGVFGVVSTPGALTGSDRCSVQDYVDTIDAAVELAGIDHVAFGSDFCLAMSAQEIFTAPEWGPAAAASVGVDADAVWPWSDGHLGFENNTGYINLTRGLYKKGYSEEDIAKVMGANYLRLLGTVGRR